MQGFCTLQCLLVLDHSSPMLWRVLMSVSGVEKQGVARQQRKGTVLSWSSTRKQTVSERLKQRLNREQREDDLALRADAIQKGATDASPKKAVVRPTVRG